MNFQLSEEQTLLVDSVSRFVTDNYGLDARTELAASSDGFSPAHWQQFAELGWLALPFDEADGGFGGNQVDTMLLFEQFGRGLVLEPYLATVVLAGGALRRSSNGALRQRLIPRIVDGSTRMALAFAEPQARFDCHDVATRAERDGDGFVLRGAKSMVANAEGAAQIIVSARTSGAQSDRQGITLFAVDAAAEGLNCQHFPTVDGHRASELTLDGVRVEADAAVTEIDRGFPVLFDTIMDGILAVSAEAVGAMEILYKDTVEYTQQREQFDHPLSDFQVLQHRMVDMFMEYEQCKSLLYRATLETAQQGAAAQRTIHALKYLVGKTAYFIGENAVQLHGGMGMTEELAVGHYFKRLLVLEAMFGNTDHHLEQFARDQHSEAA